MRLINNIPIRILHELILSRETFGTAKSFIAAGEKLKIAEQKLNFLKRCKRRQVFPVFILNSFSHQQSLFPICQSRNIQHHLKRLRTVALNQQISYQYQLIADSKLSIAQFKNTLYNTVELDVFHRIIATSERNQVSIKEQYKMNLQNKFT